MKRTPLKRSTPLRSARRRKCKGCREWFKPDLPLQVVCSWSCGIAWVQVREERKRKKELRAAKEKIKTLSQHLKECQTAFNKYVRLRDAELGCVSCDKPASWGGQWHASHFRPSGSHPEHRFSEKNVHKSCSECNNFKSGALNSYRPNLILRVGLAEVERLETDAPAPKFTVEQIIEIKRLYRKKCRDLEKKAPAMTTNRDLGP